jgi:hypothetical protein
MLCCCAGLLASVSASLPAFAQHLQQQLAAGNAAAAAAASEDAPLTKLLSMCVPRLLCLWHPGSINHMPSLVPTMARTLLPLVQQLQAGIPPLLAAAGAAAAAQGSLNRLQIAYVKLQQGMGIMLMTLLGHGSEMGDFLDADAEEAMDALLLHPAVTEMMLQSLVACTAQLHQYHVQHKQQQQQQQHPAMEQHRADLLHIPAFHEDMLQLLPGGQAYLIAAATTVSGYDYTTTALGQPAAVQQSIRVG